MSEQMTETKASRRSELRDGVYRLPWYTIADQGGRYAVEVYIPGVSKSGVELSFDDGTLTILAHRTDNTVPEGWRTLRREISREDYRLVLEINVPVNVDDISAKVEDGILRLTLPKAEELKPRQIKVQ